MKDKSEARDLLETARAVLLERLLPVLPEGARLDARMVASAMAIAARGMGVEARGMGAGDPAPDAALAMAIRNGQHDGDPALLARLRNTTRGRLAVSNPRAL